MTAERIYQEYKTNHTNMKKDAVGAITPNFCDVAATVNHRMLQVPELVRILRELDGMPRLVFNPLDSHSRLQAIINKCKTQESLIYVCQALEYMVKKEELPGLSVEDIKGRSRDGNKGELDLILFKQKVWLALIAKGLQWFEDSPGAKWIHDEVATKTQDFVVWAATESGSLHWRAGRSPSEIAFLNLLVDIMFKKTYDAPIKIALRASQTAEEALQKDGIAQAVQAVEEKRAEEKPAGGDEVHAELPMDEREPGELEELKFTLNVATTDGAAAERQVVNMGDVPDDKRAQLESACANARTHLRSNVELDAMEDGATVMEKLLRSSVGKERANGVDSYTAIFFDPKLSGEPTHRPNIRTAPLRAEYGNNTKKVIARFQAEPEALPVGDAYFLFDNGKSGNYPELMKPFAGM